MPFGFKRIKDLSPLGLKDLNDQLELLWKKVMGGMAARDFGRDEAARFIEENAQSVRQTLRAGGYRIEILDEEEDRENPRVAITPEAGGFGLLCADRICGGDTTLADLATGDVYLYVSSSAGCDANDATEASPVRTMAEAQRRIPAVGNSRTFLMLKAGDEWTEDITLYNKAVTVALDKYGAGANPIVRGQILADNVQRLVLCNIAFVHHGSASTQWLRARGVNLFLYNASVSRGAGAPAAAKCMRLDFTQAHLTDLSIIGFETALDLYYASLVSLRSSTGVCGRVAFVFGSILLGDGTWPDHVNAKYMVCSGGKVLSEGTSATGQMPDATAVPAVNTYACTATGSWLKESVYDGNGDRVYQGALDGQGPYSGVMIFPRSAISADIGGAAVRTARLFLCRGDLYNNPRRVHLYGSSKAALSGGAPDRKQDYGHICAIHGGQNAWFGVPVQAVNDLAAGTIQSLSIYDGANNYLWLYGHGSGGADRRPKLEIVFG